jgi:hypothetical protein
MILTYLNILNSNMFIVEKKSTYSLSPLPVPFIKNNQSWTIVYVSYKQFISIL